MSKQREHKIYEKKWYRILSLVSSDYEIMKKKLEIYGNDNKSRLTGKCETASWENFSYSVGGRDGSIRIGYETHRNQKGYFEDRRPGANMDPYQVTSYIAKSICNI